MLLFSRVLFCRAMPWVALAADTSAFKLSIVIILSSKFIAFSGNFTSRFIFCSACLEVSIAFRCKTASKRNYRVLCWYNFEDLYLSLYLMLLCDVFMTALFYFFSDTRMFYYDIHICSYFTAVILLFIKLRKLLCLSKIIKLYSHRVMYWY